MSSEVSHVTAVVLDWAGTMVDYGSRAPTIVFQEVFRRRGVPITVEQARGPMGMAKREHIAAIAAMPEVDAAWRAAHGGPCQESDVDAMYLEFLPLQKSILSEHSDLIPGAAEAVEACRRLGLKIGSSTGYTRELMEIVREAARQQGYVPDLILCAEDAPRGRPAPYLLYEASKRLEVYPLWTMIKVDDTPVGVQAGRNAGCWTVGVTMTGNCLGLSQAEVLELTDQERDRLCENASTRLTAAGAHYTISSVAELPEIVRDVERRLRAGESPVSILPQARAELASV